jgi:hypothetical protein
MNRSICNSLGFKLELWNILTQVFADIVYLRKIYCSTIHLSMTFRVESICFRKIERISLPMIYLQPQGFLCSFLEVVSFIMKPQTVTCKHKCMLIYKNNYRSCNQYFHDIGAF